MIIALVHWGDEYHANPGDEQLKIYSQGSLDTRSIWAESVGQARKEFESSPGRSGTIRIQPNSQVSGVDLSAHPTDG